MTTKLDFETKIEEQIKACIHCGMCLPACPTYNVSHNEANSPRGRIYLINELLKKDEVVEKSLTENSDVFDYLDNCLSCFACETVCPSNVEYGDILHFARKDLGYTKYNKGFFASIRRLFFAFVINNRLILRLIRFKLDIFGFLIKPIMLIFGFGKQAKLIPNFNEDYKQIKEGKTFKSLVPINILDEKRTVNLSLGCVMDALFNEVHWHTIQVLNAFGYHVHISKSNCCGSLAAHSGEFELGERQKKKFIKTIEKEELPLITNSAGCGAHLKESKCSIEIYDFVELLKKAPHNPFEKIQHQEKILYHPACHLNHRQGVSDYYEEILNSIQGIELITLDQKDSCCGSAGFYNLIKPEMASEIGKLKVSDIPEIMRAGKSPEKFSDARLASSEKAELTDSSMSISRDERNAAAGDFKATCIVTANPGCMSQIKAHLSNDYKLFHPATFLSHVISKQ